MTRWARSGNSQKHTKMPGDATPWKEFFKSNVKYNKQQPKRAKNNQNLNYKVKPVMQDFDYGKEIKSMNSIKDIESVKICEQSLKNEKTLELSNLKCTGSETYFDAVNLHDNSSEIIPEKNFIEKMEYQQHVSLEQQKGKKKFGKKHQKNMRDKNIENLSTINVSEKKDIYMKKLIDKRTKNGILLLPAKIERKLYNIKRKLRGKGVPASVIKDIMRKERRKEEIKFRKTFNPSKPCFNCRQTDHILADCPVKLGSSNQETGICFKCGSVEHTSFRCPNKVQGFPFAKCFICKEQGHISRDCPSNKQGVYPKGGKCNLCGNINHLKKDCPTLKKIKEEDSVTVHTINEATSVDAEIIDENKIIRDKVKKPKVVKF